LRKTTHSLDHACVAGAQNMIAICSIVNLPLSRKKFSSFNQPLGNTRAWLLRLSPLFPSWYLNTPATHAGALATSRAIGLSFADAVEAEKFGTETKKRNMYL
jgi:hypothetical protein